MFGRGVKMKTEIIIGIICIIGLIMSGCAISESSESLQIPIKMQDGSIEYAKWESKIWQGLFLYYTKTKQIRKQTPFTITSVGEMESMPDPNSIETVGNIGALLIRP